MSEMVWVPFPGKLPSERRYVLVQLSEDVQHGLPPSVVVGYLRIWSTELFFVTPGVKQEGRQVLAWSDCLGDNFSAPLWAGKQS